MDKCAWSRRRKEKDGKVKSIIRRKNNTINSWNRQTSHFQTNHHYSSVFFSSFVFCSSLLSFFIRLGWLLKFHFFFFFLLVCVRLCVCAWPIELFIGILAGPFDWNGIVYSKQWLDIFFVCKCAVGIVEIRCKLIL